MRGDHLSGWILTSLVLVLFLYPLRKRFVTLPFGSVAAWLQTHVLLGGVSIVIFLWHLDYQIPQGPFETLLGGVFALILLSGLIGLVILKVLPGRLSSSDQDLIYERIPQAVRGIRLEMEELVLEHHSFASMGVLHTLYSSRLKSFFASPAGLGDRLFRQQRVVSGIMMELDALSRHADSVEVVPLKELKRLVSEKDALDRIRVLQGVLKYWPIFHMTLAAFAALLIITHILLSLAFSGGGWGL